MINNFLASVDIKAFVHICAHLQCCFCLVSYFFKSDALAAGQHTLGFMKLLLSGKLVSMFVCVCVCVYVCVCVCVCVYGLYGLQTQLKAKLYTYALPINAYGICIFFIYSLSPIIVGPCCQTYHLVPKFPILSILFPCPHNSRILINVISSIIGLVGDLSDYFLAL